jgi:hypothetical protein
MHRRSAKVLDVQILYKLRAAFAGARKCGLPALCALSSPRGHYREPWHLLWHAKNPAVAKSLNVGVLFTSR